MHMPYICLYLYLCLCDYLLCTVYSLRTILAFSRAPINWYVHACSMGSKHIINTVGFIDRIPATITNTVHDLQT